MNLQDTQKGFSHLSNQQLKHAYRLFWWMNAIKLYKFSAYFPTVFLRVPLIKKIVSNTLFRQFVGGESLAKLTPTIRTLEKFEMGAVLDYGVESLEDESSFEQALQQFQDSVRYAKQFANVNWISIKLTAFFPSQLLAQVSKDIEGKLWKFLADKKDETLVDNQWLSGIKRIEMLCNTCVDNQMSLMIDAEESWMQDAIDLATCLMMKKFNHTSSVVANTFQLYRKDRLSFLKESQEFTVKHNVLLGAKLVRGAYIEKEASYAQRHHTPNPLFENKQLVDKAFDEGLLFCLQEQTITTIIATHNEKSILLATKHITKMSVNQQRQFLFCQLYGMGDHISFNLLDAKFKVAKYIPYGEMKMVFSYLMRRVKENSSIKGQASRELSLLTQEMKRRNLLK